MLAAGSDDATHVRPRALHFRVAFRTDRRVAAAALAATPPWRSRATGARAARCARVGEPRRRRGDGVASLPPTPARRASAPARSRVPVADAAVVAADLPDAGRGEKKFAHFRAFGLVRREIGGVGGREFFLPVQVVANASRASANARAHRAMREKKKRDNAETRATLGFQRSSRNSFA
ncbi:hypothetical protein [Lysobacter enzymogenes]|uniref:hypothetical protein n=1 Tax=Lysobacter enzymogenes TaxID=69 RepID=UPI0011177089|nr:hypothetical protein [Lysobacter enzymogenes]UZW59677.1 hypothetical protein BV903_020670 [Lysobacter enzymogenes]